MERMVVSFAGYGFVGRAGESVREDGGLVVGCGGRGRR